MSDDQNLRYARQLILPEVGPVGQARLRAARILIVGLGGLGAPAALYLAAAGVGTLGLMDGDTVSISNLQRQIIYTTGDVGQSKTDTAAQRLHAANPHIHLQLHSEMATQENAPDVFSQYDIILDGTDNFATHYLINDAATRIGKPLVWGNVERFAGQIGVMLPGQNACYRCLYPAPPPSGVAPACDEIGVLGPVPGIIGTMQAMEVLKIILKVGKPLTDYILRLNSLSMEFKKIKTARDPDCAACRNQRNITPAKGSIMSATLPEITPDELRAELASARPPFLLDVRNDDEFAASRIEGAYLIPLPQLEQRLAEIPAGEIVVYCRSGGRSTKALNLLKSNGFTHVRNLTGGIMAMQTTGDL